MLTIRLQMLHWASLARNRLPEGPEPVRAFLESRRLAGGGFSGRDDKPDLYYTSFAADLFRALGGDDPPPGLTDYLDRALTGTADMDLVHLCCLIRSRRSLGLACDGRFADRLAEFRSADGGFATSPNARTGSSYGAFLAVGAWEELDSPPEDINAVAESVLALRCRGGSFANDSHLRIGSVPGTAAAVVALRHMDRPADPESADWLSKRQLASGGFEPVAGLGRADLLSTATAMAALAGEGRLTGEQAEAAVPFVHRLYRGGGFAASEDDRGADCEYTWYALLALGLLEEDQA